MKVISKERLQLEMQLGKLLKVSNLFIHTYVCCSNVFVIIDVRTVCVYVCIQILCSIHIRMYCVHLNVKASPENGSTVAGMHASEMFSSKHKLDHLEEENRRIREELRKATEELSVYKGADMELENSSLKMQISSLKQQLEQQAKDIVSVHTVLCVCVCGVRRHRVDMYILT